MNNYNNNNNSTCFFARRTELIIRRCRVYRPRSCASRRAASGFRVFRTRFITSPRHDVGRCPCAADRHKAVLLLLRIASTTNKNPKRTTCMIRNINTQHVVYASERVNKKQKKKTREVGGIFNACLRVHHAEYTNDERETLCDVCVRGVYRLRAPV